MKHKRHQKDRRDKDDRYRLDDHRYFKPESHSVKHKVQQHYIMRDMSNNSPENENEPKKLIIYIVNIVLSPPISHPFIESANPAKTNYFIQPIFALYFLGTNRHQFTNSASCRHFLTSRAKHTKRESECNSFNGLGCCK